ncbi:uncharacterized protein I206_102084 [Kwoniella pini CBS 10737]|uniref:Uncharacterized protein n=1 Tax=Kwoniella pini CBS 10737 TaxID=1296096 RepID=A0A1B9HUV7_9TREE|nr:uncharacterized protein I206_06823 [Kwoniella pini CBS 10737]OCF47049.1 hypothetical protein I206_06823 [Kwoniella pini CBS 10737]
MFTTHSDMHFKNPGTSPSLIRRPDNHQRDNARPVPKPKKGDFEEWFESKDNEINLDQFKRLNIDKNIKDKQPYEYIEPGWKQPRFKPSEAYDKALAKERMLAPQIGGRSKKAQLGSIEESWGNGPRVPWLGEDEERKGMFELDEDPPSRNVSPFIESEENEDPMEASAVEEEDKNSQVEIERKRQELLVNARRGTTYEFSENMKDFFGGGGITYHERQRQQMEDEEKYANDDITPHYNYPDERRRYHGEPVVPFLLQYSQQDDDLFSRWIKENRKMVLEQSTNKGQTGEPHHYFHRDCLSPKDSYKSSDNGNNASSEQHQRSAQKLLSPLAERRAAMSPVPGNRTKDIVAPLSAGHSPSFRSARASDQAEGPLQSKHNQDVKSSVQYRQSAEYKAWLRRADIERRRRK